nr:GTPase RsgA [Candidatus Akkermansia timonensis]
MPVTLQDLGWNDHFQDAFDAIAKPGWIPGRLIRETKINFTALLDGGEDMDVVVSGKLWHDAATDAELPAVGDWVAIDPGEAEDEAVIRVILPRRTCFSRKAPGKSSAEQVLGANVDIVAVVTEPGTDFNPRRMERYFTLIRRSGAMPLILLNKVDLFSRKEVEEATHILRELCPECGIICISALRNKGIKDFRKCLERGKTISIVGSSGVGKSTLVNTLLGDEWLWTGK